MTRRRLTQILFILAALSLSPLPVLAQSATPAATPIVENGIYRDPAGRFTVPVPDGWNVTLSDGVATLTDPDDDLQILALVVTAPTAQEGIDLAWKTADPGPARAETPDVQAVPSGPGIDETVVVTDDIGRTSGQIAQAVGQRVGTQVYVLIAVGSLEAAVKRASQTQVILTGFTITSLTKIDLSKTEPAPLGAATITELDAYVTALMKRLGIPGASIAVVQDGRVVFSSGYGTTNMDGGHPVDPDTLMMIGSVSKSFTTTMMASEVDDSLFAWDTPVVDLYPTFALSDPTLTKALTMRDLVCACTGVPRRDLEFILNAESLTPQDVIASLATFDLYSKYDETFQYSNQMVAAAGYISADQDHPAGNLEADYQASLQERVLDPIGMTRSTIDLDTAAADPNHAVPHGLSLLEGYQAIPVDDERVLEPVAPSGMIWSSASEMSAYLVTQMQDGVAPNGTRVASASSLNETRVPQVQIDATTSYGLGWMIGDFHGQTIVGHGGNTMGFSSEVSFLPNAGVGIVILTNAQGANLFTVAVEQRFYELAFGLEPELNDAIDQQISATEDQLAKAKGQIGKRPDASEATTWTGAYTSEVLGTITIAVNQQGALMVSTGELNMEIRPVVGSRGSTLLIVGPPLAGVSLTVADGQLVLTMGIDTYTFRKVGPPGTGTPAASPIATPA
jgi:CubicO group peptidase (beta-lactamase class C family)